MITWMQRHKKWLIITIWISTIAFVGAGFVGWGQYTYGDKAGAVAKVGDVEITQGELQKTYSRIYARYNQMFQGNFDEEKAKQFRLQSQALQELIQKALVINLAKSYDLEVHDEELIKSLKKQNIFFKNGNFDKEIYKQVLSQNRLTTKEYEKELRSDLLVQKVISLLPVKVTENELTILETLSNIADKINYKVLTTNDIKVDTSDEKLKTFWKLQANNFMHNVSYVLEYIIQVPVEATYDVSQIKSYYTDNRSHFKDKDGKILPINDAKKLIIKELNKKATKDQALRTYIAYKKGKLKNDVKLHTATISKNNNKFNNKTLEKISKLSLTAPYLKPISIDGIYYTIQLRKVNPSTQKTFQEAKTDVLKLYVQDAQKQALQALAQNSIDTFTGEETDFLTIQETSKLKSLTQSDAKDFLQKLFLSDQKRSYIHLNSGKIVLYYILEQKLLDNSKKELESSMKKLKDGIFSEAFIKSLENKYQTEIFIQGL